MSLFSASLPGVLLSFWLFAAGRRVGDLPHAQESWNGSNKTFTSGAFSAGPNWIGPRLLPSAQLDSSCALLIQFREQRMHQGMCLSFAKLPHESGAGSQAGALQGCCGIAARSHLAQQPAVAKEHPSQQYAGHVAQPLPAAGRPQRRLCRRPQPRRPLLQGCGTAPRRLLRLLQLRRHLLPRPVRRQQCSGHHREQYAAAQLVHV